MYFLLSACEHPAILRIIYFIFKLIDIATIIIPIGLILILSIDFFKAVISPNEDGQKKTINFVTKRIIYAIVIFLVPTIINFVLNILTELEVNHDDYLVCINNAKSGDFTIYDKLLAEEERIEEEKRRQRLEQNRLEQEQLNNGSDILNGDNNSNSGTSNNMASVLISLIEKEEGNTNSSKYGASSGVAWCAYFVTWGMKNTTYGGKNLFYDIIEKENKVENIAGAGCTIYNFDTSSNLDFYHSDYWAKKLNKKNYTPKAGDTIYFDWRTNGLKWDGKVRSCNEMFTPTDHIGFVHYVKDGKVYTIEGNAGGGGGKVMKRSFDLSDPQIMGYGSWYK